MAPSRPDVTKRINNNTNPVWWRDSGMRKLNFMIVCVITAQMTCGYDEAVVGNFQAMKPWLEDMGHPDPSHIGLITTIIFVGGFIGAFPASPISDRFGRKPALLIGSLFTLVGTVIQTSAFGYAQFMVGRGLLGVGISFTCVAGPAMVAELAHPRQRGTVLGFFNTFWYVGAIVAAWGSFGSGHLATSWSWRVPSLIQGIAPIFLITMLPFMPESPRFLLARGRTEEAREVLAEYHANGEMEDDLVLFEIDQINTALAIESRYSELGWNILWNTSANRKKMALTISVFVMCLWCGQGVISYYFSPLLTSLHVTGTNQQTGINGGMQIWNFLVSILGAGLADRIGRRSLWLISMIAMICSNVGITITSAVFAHDETNNVAAYMAILFLFFYNAGFNIACNPLAYAYPTEILPYSMRTKGMAVMVAIGQALLIVSQYANPVAIAAIGWKYWLFFLGMLVLFLAMVYFTYPETKGLTLEELARLFEDDQIEDSDDKLMGIEVAPSVMKVNVNMEKKA